MSVIPRRMSAKIDGDFVVFLIGARLNNWLKLGQFKWVGDSMSSMLAELEKKPESGFLGHESLGLLPPVMVQYWRSPEQLIAYARSRDAVHYPVWVQFNRELAKKPEPGDQIRLPIDRHPQPEQPRQQPGARRWLVLRAHTDTLGSIGARRQARSL